MQGESRIVLWVDEQHREKTEQIDLSSGTVHREETSAGDFCRRLGVGYRVLTEELKALGLYEKKGKDGQTVTVTLGELAPFILARVEGGQVTNAFSAHDFGKPMRLSRATIVALREIFGGTAKLGQLPPTGSAKQTI